MATYTPGGFNNLGSGGDKLTLSGGLGLNKTNPNKYDFSNTFKLQDNTVAPKVNTSPSVNQQAKPVQQQSGMIAQPVAGSPTSFSVNGQVHNLAQPQQTSNLQAIQNIQPTPQPQQVQNNGQAISDVVNRQLQQGNVVNLGGVTNASQVQGQPQVTFPGIIGNLVNNANRNTQLGDEARQIANRAGQQITDIGQQASRANAGYSTTGTSPIAEGNAAVIANTAANQQQAIAQGAAQQLQGTQQALSGQNQYQSALNQAGGLVQPSLGQYGQTYYSPLGGQQGGAGVTPDNPFYQTLQQYARLRSTGQESLIPADISGNAVLNAQVTQMAQGINPSFNANTTGAQAQSAAQLTGEQSALQAQSNGAKANFQLLQNIASQGGVNDTNVPILNILNQNVQRGTTSSEAVTSFRSVLQALRSQYASMFGLSPEQVAQQIPDNISLSALNSVAQNLDATVQNRIQGLNQQVGSLTGSGGGSIYQF